MFSPTVFWVTASKVALFKSTEFPHVFHYRQIDKKCSYLARRTNALSKDNQGLDSATHLSSSC